MKTKKPYTHRLTVRFSNFSLPQTILTNGKPENMAERVDTVWNCNSWFLERL